MSIEYIVTFVISLDKLQNIIQGKFRALHTEEALNDIFVFRIASEVPSCEILLQSRKQMKITWCEIRTDGWCRRSQTMSYNMVSHCRCRVWYRILIRLLARTEKPRLLFQNHLFQFRSGCHNTNVTIPAT
ncbi:hypothetical protein TNCV_2314881 [Trichonephila clavipes]|nr:hypothetical protein TNCV_2314881 [Trichonephila clavipes]